MGTYTDLTVAGYPVLSSKSQAIAEAMTIFRECDKRVYQRRMGERNPLVWDSSGPPEDDEVETATEYARDTSDIIARLEVMGFTMHRAKEEFEAGRLAELEKYASWRQDESDSSWFDEDHAFMQSLTFEGYIAAFGQVVEQGLRADPFDDNKIQGLSPTVRYILDGNDDFLFGFFPADVRYLIRAVCEVVAQPSEVVQDITNLVEGGYYEKDEPVSQMARDSLISGHLENGNRIILTEGSTDSQILRKAMHLLYPHLADYYSFLDFEALKVPGGAGQLVSVIKAFAAAGIGNRVVALFDNDTAAHDARRSLANISLPSNIAIFCYPDIELLRRYPTLGPNGRTDLDVNGLAASIELYLGEDVLRQQDGTLVPVQWKGFIEPVGRYQGEVMKKSELNAAFSRKHAAAKADDRVLTKQDWTGLDAILQVIFSAFCPSP